MKDTGSDRRERRSVVLIGGASLRILRTKPTAIQPTAAGAGSRLMHHGAMW